MQTNAWLEKTADEFWEDRIVRPEAWHWAAISIHSHWLSQEETEAHWMTFAVLTSQSDRRWGEFMEKEEAFVQLFRILEQDHGLRLWLEKEFQGTPKGTTSDIAALCRRNVREDKFDLFVSDDLEVVILGNYDLTFPVFKISGRSWDPLRELVNSVGLYLLS